MERGSRGTQARDEEDKAGRERRMEKAKEEKNEE